MLKVGDIVKRVIEHDMRFSLLALKLNRKSRKIAAILPCNYRDDNKACYACPGRILLSGFKRPDCCRAYNYITDKYVIDVVVDTKQTRVARMKC